MARRRWRARLLREALGLVLIARRAILLLDQMTRDTNGQVRCQGEGQHTRGDSGLDPLPLPALLHRGTARLVRGHINSIWPDHLVRAQAAVHQVLDPTRAFTAVSHHSLSNDSRRHHPRIRTLAQRISTRPLSPRHLHRLNRSSSTRSIGRQRACTLFRRAARLGRITRLRRRAWVAARCLSVDRHRPLKRLLQAQVLCAQR